MRPSSSTSTAYACSPTRCCAAEPARCRRRGPAPTPDQVSDVDAVLISHLHHDHAELTSIRLLPDLPLLTGPRNAAFLRKRKLQGVDLGDTWYDVGDAGVQVRLVRADHHARKMPHRPNDAYGHLVRTPTRRIWLAGDTSLYPEMADLPDLAGGPLDLAVVPVGGWGPRLSGGHMDPEQAAARLRGRRCPVRGALPLGHLLRAEPGQHPARLDGPARSRLRRVAGRARAGLRGAGIRTRRHHRLGDLPREDVMSTDHR